MHTPRNKPNYEISQAGFMINPSAHRMENYIKSLHGAAGWKALASISKPVELSERIEQWLASASGNNVGMFSVQGHWMIIQALERILKKSAIVVAGTALTVGATILDRMAWLLSEGARLSAKIASEVRSVVTMIFQFLGRTVNRMENFTTSFLRWVLSLLVSTLRIMAQRAVWMINHS